uniref:Uncharacterized protein n=1 Tax=Arundo donax TaxID=35708 RepID=A0A0A9ATG9_ARUDO
MREILSHLDVVLISSQSKLYYELSTAPSKQQLGL